MDPSSSSPKSAAAVLDVVVAPVARALWSIRWSRCLAWLARLAALPLRLLGLPLSWAASVLLVVLAPALYILSFLASWARALAALVAGLEPLYTFFGAAAAVGIVSGIALGAASSIITSSLGIHDEPETGERHVPRLEKYRLGLPAASPAVVETDWYWTGSSSSRHRRPSGLLSQTIHEEGVDDSDY